MPKNVEIKAKVQDLQFLKELAVKLSSEEGTVLEQEDTFFNAPNGRLKLRVTKNNDKDEGQLIFYVRPDTEGPKTSDYHITRTNNPSDLKKTLELSLGIKGEVKKKRTLYMVGQTRVHVDEVEGLGNFMELEVVMRPDQEENDGQQIADDLMSKLEVKSEDLLDCAYMDLILKSDS